MKLLKQESDLVEVVTSPTNFHAVGQYYQKFEPIEDAKVIEMDTDELLSKIYEELEGIQQAIERLGKHLGHLAVVRSRNSES